MRITKKKEKECQSVLQYVYERICDEAVLLLLKNVWAQIN